MINTDQLTTNATRALETFKNLSTQRPRALRAAAVNTAAVLTWYAMPDVIRSRGLRTFFKAGLVGAIGWAIANQFEETESYREVQALLAEHDCPQADDTGFAPGSEPVSPQEDPLEGVTEADPKELAILGAVASAAVIATVSAEKAIFRRGERRRHAGARFAHLRQGLVLAGITAVLEASMLLLEKDEADAPCPDTDSQATDAVRADSAQL
ncbi:hypothetical protein [Schaalia vaccimaxillae]|uniref:hypothetical protein n=1 Tax=Schaalia vaccimaxillae TaxID=183916 RepID=UPI0003B40735|nr:hypothetical protein [Schaalia vaccimaxillae]